MDIGDDERFFRPCGTAAHTTGKRNTGTCDFALERTKHECCSCGVSQVETNPTDICKSMEEQRACIGQARYPDKRIAIPVFQQS